MKRGDAALAVSPLDISGPDCMYVMYVRCTRIVVAEVVVYLRDCLVVTVSGAS
jgi:hypothetical protein